jgi:hypothetical protein
VVRHVCVATSTTAAALRTPAPPWKPGCCRVSSRWTGTRQESVARRQPPGIKLATIEPALKTCALLHEPGCGGSGPSRVTVLLVNARLPGTIRWL